MQLVILLFLQHNDTPLLEYNGEFIMNSSENVSQRKRAFSRWDVTLGWWIGEFQLKRDQRQELLISQNRV